MTLLITFGNRGVVDNYFMGKRLAQLKAENNELAVQNKELAGKIILLRSDPAYIESIARNELGMVKKGDVVYRMTK
ncbi:MAG: septum formation initiator family protein [Smithellaceae bacterium]|jgi:cell division protein FtsB|nr:septum formation initiator family protein [Smithellaceae bacterium]